MSASEPHIIPAIPPEVLHLGKRGIPAWGRTIGSMIAFGFVAGLFASFLTIVGYYLAREMYPLSPARAVLPIAFAALCDLLVIVWFVRAIGSRRVMQRGNLVMGYVSDATHITKRGGLNTLKLRYRFEVAGVPYTGKVRISDIEMRKLHRPVDRRDFVLVTHAPGNPKRNLAWGFVFDDGRATYPR